MHMGKMGLSFMAVVSLFLGACGNEERQFVKDFSYDVSQPNMIDFDVEFNNDLTLNTEFNVPIMGYGSVRFTPNLNDSGVRVGTSLNLDAFVDPEILNLSKTRRLPNQEPMSPYVERDVARLWIKANDDVATSVYFGFEPEKFYLGTSVEINFMDEDFPSGLVITQRLRDLKNRPVGIVTLYGPKVDKGTIVAPGGIFIMTNVSDLLKYAKEDRPSGFVALEGTSALTRSHGLLPSNDTYINQKEYRKQEKLFELLMLYRQKAQEAGLGN